jgi:hypothetical protein
METLNFKQLNHKTRQPNGFPKWCPKMAFTTYVVMFVNEIIKNKSHKFKVYYDKTIGNILWNIDMYFRQYYLINLLNM